jgi:hypothetical protein
MHTVARLIWSKMIFFGEKPIKIRKSCKVIQKKYRVDSSIANSVDTAQKVNHFFLHLHVLLILQLQM